MQPWPRIATRWTGPTLALALTLSGCSAAAVAPTPTPSPAPSPTAIPSPTPPPSPTPVPVFAEGSSIGGVSVAGLTLDAAAAKVSAELDSALKPVELRIGGERVTLRPEAVGAEIPVEELLSAARPALGGAIAARVPMEVRLDADALRSFVEGVADELVVEPSLELLTDTDPISRSFVFTPGRTLDIDGAVEDLTRRLQDPFAVGPLTLTLEDLETPAVDFEALELAALELAGEWQGVAGFYLYDLESGREIGINEGTVFAGASTIKVAIMLNAYMNLDRFSKTQEDWLKRMIVESDNLAANGLLAAATGYEGTEWAFVGADRMSTMLQEQLGLEHTYLYVPYETTDFIKLYKPKFRCGPRGPVGDKPYTEMGSCLRATPYAMAQIYRMIDECSRGEGILPEEYKRLTPKRCQEMLDRLATNGDDTRFASGLPEGARIEHKSGWIGDMQADCGIVRSDGGDFVICAYLYRPLPAGRSMWGDGVFTPYLGAFARLAYSAYNPARAEAEASGATRP